MGKICIIYSIKPENPKTNLETIKEEIQKIEHFSNLEEKPFMFGMKQILATFTLPDAGGTEKLEQKLKSIPGVSSISQETMTLV